MSQGLVKSPSFKAGWVGQVFGPTWTMPLQFTPKAKNAMEETRCFSFDRTRNGRGEVDAMARRFLSSLQMAPCVPDVVEISFRASRQARLIIRTNPPIPSDFMTLTVSPIDPDPPPPPGRYILDRS